PFELLEYIIHNIENVSDLLSFALTSRAFCALIIPWHIEYRWISCHHGRTNLWKTLCNKPYLATRIR
ncbi:hypothetical protein M422DRAFT_107211, partial [Sphaerobolus stellatus SS14]